MLSGRGRRSSAVEPLFCKQREGPAEFTFIVPHRVSACASPLSLLACVHHVRLGHFDCGHFKPHAEPVFIPVTWPGAALS